MKNIKSFDEFGIENTSEGALGTAAASLGMRGKGSSSYRNTSKGSGDKNEWKKYVNPKRWFTTDKLEDDEKDEKEKDEKEVNELFGDRRDKKTKQNLKNIKDISDKQKENEPEAKLAKYKKMRDGMIADLEKSLEDDEINEELKPETYFSAADKLQDKGHNKRADIIRQHAREMGKNIDPITVEMYGKTYTLGADNIELDGGNDYKVVLIWFDLSTKISDDEEEPEDYDGPMLTCLNFYKDRTERVRVGDLSPNVKHSDRKYIDKKFPGWTFDTDGVSIPNRKVAVKVLKLVKDWAKSIEDRELAEEIDKITVNDLYFE